MDTNLLILAIVLLQSYTLSLLFKRYKLPEVIAQILAGLILGIPIIKNIFFPEDNIVSLFSEIGIVFLLLLTGMEVDYGKLIKEKKEIMVIALFSFLFPFCLGFTSMKLLGYSNMVAIIVGFSLSLTAEGTKLKLLMDFNLLKTKIGEVMIGAGIADDIFEIIGLSFVLIGVSGKKVEWFKFPIEILLFIIFIILLIKFLPSILREIKKSATEVEYFTLVIILGLSITFIGQILELGTVIGAFIGGIIIHKLFNKEQEEKNILKNLKMITFGFVVPFFFVDIGLKFNYDNPISNPYIFLIILTVAIIGKLLGSIVVSFFSDITFRQAVLIGWGMNSRGAVELIIIGIAKSAGIIDDLIFNSILLMTIITTLMFPLILRSTLKKYPNIMN